MKRTAVIKRLRVEAKKRGLSFEIAKLTRHDAIIVGGVSRTLGRHNEIDDVTVKRFYAQFDEVLGRGWWRQ